MVREISRGRILYKTVYRGQPNVCKITNKFKIIWLFFKMNCYRNTCASNMLGATGLMIWRCNEESQNFLSM